MRSECISVETDQCRLTTSSSIQTAVDLMIYVAGKHLPCLRGG